MFPGRRAKRTGQHDVGRLVLVARVRLAANDRQTASHVGAQRPIQGDPENFVEPAKSLAKSTAWSWHDSVGNGLHDHERTENEHGKLLSGAGRQEVRAVNCFKLR